VLVLQGRCSVGWRCSASVILMVLCGVEVYC
jgi:hypothetical protein